LFSVIMLYGTLAKVWAHLTVGQKNYEAHHINWLTYVGPSPHKLATLVSPTRLLSSCPDYIEPALPLEIERAPCHHHTTAATRGARVATHRHHQRSPRRRSSCRNYLDQELASPRHPRVYAGTDHGDSGHRRGLQAAQGGHRVA
jgi:hypothetical protein